MYSHCLTRVNCIFTASQRSFRRQACFRCLHYYYWRLNCMMHSKCMFYSILHQCSVVSANTQTHTINHIGSCKRRSKMVFVNFPFAWTVNTVKSRHRSFIHVWIFKLYIYSFRIGWSVVCAQCTYETRRLPIWFWFFVVHTFPIIPHRRLFWHDCRLCWIACKMHEMQETSVAVRNNNNNNTTQHWHDAHD